MGKILAAVFIFAALAGNVQALDLSNPNRPLTKKDVREILTLISIATDVFDSIKSKKSFDPFKRWVGKSPKQIYQAREARNKAEKRRVAKNRKKSRTPGRGRWRSAGKGFLVRQTRITLGGSTVVGELKNISGRNYSRLTFKITLFDARGRILTTAVARVGNFGNRGVKKFKARTSSPPMRRVARIRVVFRNGF